MAPGLFGGGRYYHTDVTFGDRLKSHCPVGRNTGAASLSQTQLTVDLSWTYQIQGFQVWRWKS